MTEKITQVRLPIGLEKEMDSLISKGLYSNKSDLIRDAVRKLIFLKEINETNNSVEQVKKVRSMLQNDEFSIDEINSLK